MDGEEPEEESEDGAFCDVEDQEETEEPKTQSKRDKAKELRKRHKGGSMWLLCTQLHPSCRFDSAGTTLMGS